MTNIKFTFTVWCHGNIKKRIRTWILKCSKSWAKMRHSSKTTWKVLKCHNTSFEIRAFKVWEFFVTAKKWNSVKIFFGMNDCIEEGGQLCASFQGLQVIVIMHLSTFPPQSRLQKHVIKLLLPSNVSQCTKGHFKHFEN